MASIKEFEFLVGRDIWIVSCPRRDGADAFANTMATVDEILSGDGLALRLEDGGTLIISRIHIENLKYIVLT